MTHIAAGIFRAFAGALLAAALLVPLAAPDALAADKPKLIVFDTEFLDHMMSGTGESFTTAEDISRARSISDSFREELASRYEILTPAEDSPPYDLTCPECILKIAKRQKAQYVLTSALTRMNSRTVYLKYELGDVVKDQRLVSGDFELNGFTARQIKMVSQLAVDDLLKNANPQNAAAPK